MTHERVHPVIRLDHDADGLVTVTCRCGESAVAANDAAARRWWEQHDRFEGSRDAAPNDLQTATDSAAALLTLADELKPHARRLLRGNGTRRRPGGRPVAGALGMLRELVELHDGGPIVDNQPLDSATVSVMRFQAWERARAVLAQAPPSETAPAGGSVRVEWGHRIRGRTRPRRSAYPGGADSAEPLRVRPPPAERDLTQLPAVPPRGRHRTVGAGAT